MRFEWDPQKAESNFKKHGVDFDLAMESFADPLFREKLNRVVYGEERFIGFGMVAGHLLAVVFTSWDVYGEEVVRIISARAANRAERRDHEGGT